MEIKVMERTKTKTIESREVAEMVGKNHKELLRDIRTMIGYLGESKIAPSNFFIASYYVNSQNKNQPCFLLTKEGCEMVANKISGKKGTLFTAEYVMRFNKMEQQPKELPVNNTKLLLRASLEHEEKIELLTDDVTMLKESMRIDGVQEFQIKKSGNKRVLRSLGGYESNAYNTFSKKVYARFWRDFKNYFTIPRYGELPKVKFDEAIEFINEWMPDTEMRLMIKQANLQTKLEV